MRLLSFMFTVDNHLPEWSRQAVKNMSNIRRSKQHQSVQVRTSIRSPVARWNKIVQTSELTTSRGWRSVLGSRTSRYVVTANGRGIRRNPAIETETRSTGLIVMSKTIGQGMNPLLWTIEMMAWEMCSEVAWELTSQTTEDCHQRCIPMRPPSQLHQLYHHPPGSKQTWSGDQAI